MTSDPLTDLESSKRSGKGASETFRNLLRNSRANSCVGEALAPSIRGGAPRRVGALPRHLAWISTSHFYDYERALEKDRKFGPFSL